MSKSISLLKPKPTPSLENPNNPNQNTNNHMFLILNRSIEETVSKFTQKYFNITTLLNEMHSDFLSQMKLLSEKVSTQFNQALYNTNNPNPTTSPSIPLNSPTTSSSHINYFNVNRSVKYNPLSTTNSSSHKNMPFYPKESLQSVSISDITNRKKTTSQVNLTQKSTSINKKAKKAQNDEVNICKYLNTNQNTRNKYNNNVNNNNNKPSRAKKTYNPCLGSSSNTKNSFGNSNSNKPFNIFSSRNSVQVVSSALFNNKSNAHSLRKGLQLHQPVNTYDNTNNNNNSNSNNKHRNIQSNNIHNSNIINTLSFTNQLHVHNLSKSDTDDIYHVEDIEEDTKHSNITASENIISALKVLLNSKILPYETKLTIKYLNKDLSQSKPINDLITESHDTIKSTLNQIQSQYHNELIISNSTYPSQLSQIVPYFFNDDIEFNNNSLCIITFICILLGHNDIYNNSDHSSCNELYRNILTLHNVTSLSQLLTQVIYNKVYISKSIVYEQYIELKRVYISSLKSELDIISKDINNPLGKLALVCIEIYNYLYNEYEFKNGVGCYYEWLVTTYNKLDNYLK